MKALKLILIITFILFAGKLRVSAQNMITLKDKSVIPIDSIFKINARYVEYTAGGSIHDLDIEKIKWIEDRGQFITFNEYFQAEYKPAFYKNKLQQSNAKQADKYTPLNSDSLFRKQVMAISINFFPLALFEPDHGIRTGLEIPLTPNISLHQDLNILFKTQGDILNGNVNNPSNFSGFAYRAEIKFYLEPSRKYQERFYCAPQLMIKQKQWDDTYAVYSSNPSGSSADLKYKLHEKHVIFSGNLKFGITSKVSQRLITDLYCGLGVRYTEITDKKTITGNTKDWEINKSYKATPNVLAGIMIGFRL